MTRTVGSIPVREEEETAPIQAAVTTAADEDMGGLTPQQATENQQVATQTSGPFL